MFHFFFGILYDCLLRFFMLSFMTSKRVGGRKSERVREKQLYFHLMRYFTTLMSFAVMGLCEKFPRTFSSQINIFVSNDLPSFSFFTQNTSAEPVEVWSLMSFLSVYFETRSADENCFQSNQIERRSSVNVCNIFSASKALNWWKFQRLFFPPIHESFIGLRSIHLRSPKNRIFTQFSIVEIRINSC